MNHLTKLIKELREPNSNVAFLYPGITISKLLDIIERQQRALESIARRPLFKGKPIFKNSVAMEEYATQALAEIEHMAEGKAPAPREAQLPLFGNDIHDGDCEL